MTPMRIFAKNLSRILLFACFLLGCIYPHLLLSQGTRVTEEVVEMKTYAFSDPDPIAISYKRAIVGNAIDM